MSIRKVIEKDVLDEIRYKFEAGYNLIDLATEYHINYGTLKNISSKQGWEKGSREEAIRLAELDSYSQEQVKKRETIKNKYKRIIRKQVKFIEELQKQEDFGEDKAAEEGYLTRAKTISEYYSLDKELHNITTSKEEEDIKTKRLKNQKLIDELENDNEDGYHIS